MLIHLDRHSGVPIFKQIMDQIRNQIVTGQITPGEQLDTVRDLGERLRVNPMTISKAYSLLELEGCLERRHGIGLFVRKPSADLLKRERATFFQTAVQNVVTQAYQLGISKDDLLRSVDQTFSKLTSRVKKGG